jgi:hypothetical protein
VDDCEGNHDVPLDALEYDLLDAVVVITMQGGGDAIFVLLEELS